MGWVRWQHRQVLLRSQAVDRMAFGASGREQSTTKVHLGSHLHPQRRLRKDPELLPRCRPSPVLSSATQRKMQVATPRGFHCAGCWLGMGPQLPHREGLLRAPTIGPHPSGCLCFKAAIHLDGRSYSSTGFSLDLSAQCLIFQAKMTGFLAYVTPCGCLHSALEISWS